MELLTVEEIVHMLKAKLDDRGKSLLSRFFKPSTTRNLRVNRGADTPWRRWY
jgi:hypothetical protein